MELLLRQSELITICAPKSEHSVRSRSTAALSQSW